MTILLIPHMFFIYFEVKSLQGEILISEEDIARKHLMHYFIGE